MTADPSAPSPMAHAGQILHPGPALLRERYPDGVQITPYGVPDWIPPPRGMGRDQARVLGVQTANEIGRQSGHPLWTAGDPRTPVGWTWARLPLTRQIALVPIELHGSFRHIGGVSTNRNDPSTRGLTGTEGAPPDYRVETGLAEDAVAKIEEQLGHPLPSPYRKYLATSNGGGPTFPAVIPRAGFIVDQPLFGSTVGGENVMTDVLHQAACLRDRVEPGWLPIGFVQGGLLLLKLGDGSLCYLDDDDPRDQQGYTPAQINRNLFQWIAPDFTAFWTSLRAVPASLRELAERHAAEGWARMLSHSSLGRSLSIER